MVAKCNGVNLVKDTFSQSIKPKYDIKDYGKLINQRVEF